jgi:Tfp pilus assembly protein PilF
LGQELFSKNLDVHKGLNNWEISDGIYQQLIQTDSTDAQALNNYAYSMVERGINLEISKEYAKKAVEIAPDQAAYLDTYGWILFKLNKPKEALKYIQKSLDIDGSNVEILEHLGDVYLKLKKFNKARETYNKALQIDPQNESLINKISDF